MPKDYHAWLIGELFMAEPLRAIHRAADGTTTNVRVAVVPLSIGC
jgi:hypothetical protein